MNRSAAAWVAAFIVTAASAYFQRVTGPTYPISGTCLLGATPISFTLQRSHSSASALPVGIETSDTLVAGELQWRRSGTHDPWMGEEMDREGSLLTASIPPQPPAGKVDYRLFLRRGEDSAVIPAGAPAVLRFKGDVPLAVLAAHIVLMFAGMLFSTRAGLTIVTGEERTGFLTGTTIILLFAGGLVLGPVVQKYAFGAWWTGWPFGTDLTDNKTVAALAGWCAAALMRRRVRQPRVWAAIAAAITLAVYMIPHSLFGSELDYGQARKTPPALSVTRITPARHDERATHGGGHARIPPAYGAPDDLVQLAIGRRIRL